MEWLGNSLDELCDAIWREMANDSRSLDSSWRTAVLGTQAQELESESTIRTVIVRGVDVSTRRIFCFSDFRAKKISQIQLHPRVDWLFYDPREKVQVIASGTAEIHHNNERARAEWINVPILSRLNYCAEFAPGTELNEPGSGLPKNLHRDTATIEDTEFGLANFAVIEAEIDRMDWLQLTPEGPRRAIFLWEDNSHWRGKWVVG